MIEQISQRVLASINVEADPKYPALTNQIKLMLTVEGKRRKKPMNVTQLNGATASVYMLLKQRKFLGTAGMKGADTALSKFPKPVPMDKLESVVGRLEAVRIKEAVDQALMVR